MISRYCDGVLPPPSEAADEDAELQSAARSAWSDAERHYAAWEFSEALESAWRFIAAANRYVDQTQPFRLARDPAAGARVGTILYHLADCLRQIAVLVYPAMPGVGERISSQLGCPGPGQVSWDESARWSTISPGNPVPGGRPLFPRLDMLD
ncbi:MAG: hypothetical protein OXL33_03315, partial [Chloroflexota bacterium]|nr:hypothetical protein [Chloroflexota bacterium]